MGGTAAAQPAAPLGASLSTGPLEPVPVDLPRYLGTWNQLAAIPAWFDLLCVRDTQARYTLNPDQTVTTGGLSTRQPLCTVNTAP